MNLTKIHLAICALQHSNSKFKSPQATNKFKIQNIKVSKGLDMQIIDYYFDFLSPYSYFSFKNLDKLPKNIAINYKPVAMGTVFNHWDMKGPGEIAPKRSYMLKQCFIYAAQKSIDFIPPKNHPFNPLYALRLATKACSQESQKEMIKVLFNSCWAQGIELGEPDELKIILQKNNLDPTLVDKTFEKEVKLELKRNTKEAISKNVFGVPSFCVDHELFWGNDSIENLISFLSGDFVSWDKELFNSRINPV